MRPALRHLGRGACLVLLAASALVGCEWRGLNSITLPGTEGSGAGSYTVKAELPEVNNILPNSRVRVSDVNVGHVAKIERQGWHAVVTMDLDPNVVLPENATAKVGQTSLLGSLHIELAAPTGEPARGRLHGGSVIPLSRGGGYPSTEQTLASIASLLNGGGIGQIQDINKAFSTAFRGREQDLKALIHQLDEFTARIDGQKDDIVAATDSLNQLVGQFAADKPVIDKAIKTIPDALATLKDERQNLVTALDAFGKFSAVTADSVNKTKASLVQELKDVGPVLDSLANAGPNMTRSLSMLASYPWPNETLHNWLRGDYANLTAIIDLTLSRIDTSLFTGTRWEGNLTELEMQWGRTVGQMPSPATARNPLIVPYHLDQGP